MLRKIVIVLLSFLALVLLFVLLRNHSPNIPRTSTTESLAKPVFDRNIQFKRLKVYSDTLQQYSSGKGFNQSVFFLVDMSLHSGKNRFFVYDLKANVIKAEGLVAHGSCNTRFLPEPKFSNIPDCGCSSLGKYKISYQYKGHLEKPLN